MKKDYVIIASIIGILSVAFAVYTGWNEIFNGNKRKRISQRTVSVVETVQPKEELVVQEAVQPEKELDTSGVEKQAENNTAVSIVKGQPIPEGFPVELIYEAPDCAIRIYRFNDVYNDTLKHFFIINENNEIVTGWEDYTIK